MPHSQKDLYKKLLGGRGERAAVKYLKKQGYKLLRKNYKTPFGEVDLLLSDGDTLVFAEVKTRTSAEYGTPSEAVDRERQSRYKRAAAFHLKSENIAQEEALVRFDVVEVFPFGAPQSVEIGVEQPAEKAPSKKQKGERQPAEKGFSKKQKKGKLTVRHIPAAFY